MNKTRKYAYALTSFGKGMGSREYEQGKKKAEKEREKGEKREERIYVCRMYSSEQGIKTKFRPRRVLSQI